MSRMGVDDAGDGPTWEEENFYLIKRREVGN